ncbi:MAG: NAD(P)H-hydrate dehydratase, partial [Pseudolabrys sp.]|nr:NAD(P)H-hydrate dehydratase [Pseudolabrys sp.]
DTIKPQTVLNDPEGWRGVFPRPRTEGHKYDRGHVVVVSGGLPSTGAARLAARAALRSGAGLVTIVSPPDAVAVHAAETAAIMVREVKVGAALAQFLRDKRRNSVVVGPGGGVGSQMCEQVTAALASDAAVVLDADALTSFEGKAEELAQMIAVRTAPVVLTPHEGEFARLFAEKNDGQSKLEKTRRAASAMKAIVLLKGADTVIAAPDGHACVSAQGSPYLATAGAGDVLAGTIAGLLAQGMPAFIGACAAAWIHGEAGARLGPGLIAEDLAEVYPAIIQGFLPQSAQP